MTRLLLLALIASSTARAQRAYEYDHGRWFNGRGFDRRAVYVVDDTFSFRRPPHVDSVVDLRNAYVVPPYGEAHNQNVEFYGEARARAIVAKYIAAGVLVPRHFTALSARPPSAAAAGGAARAR